MSLFDRAPPRPSTPTRLYRDATRTHVAVLRTEGYGAGWSSWNAASLDPEDLRRMIFDPEIATAILAGNLGEAEDIATARYPEAYTGGVEHLVVEWIPVGAAFRIDEYDGHERIVGLKDLVIVA